MQPNEFRRHGHAVVDWIADYLENPEQWPVLPDVRPRDLRDSLPQSPPRVLEKVNATREVYLSHTRVHGSYALRIAIGNIHTTDAHVRHALDLVREAGMRK